MKNQDGDTERVCCWWCRVEKKTTKQHNKTTLFFVLFLVYLPVSISKTMLYVELVRFFLRFWWWTLMNSCHDRRWKNFRVVCDNKLFVCFHSNCHVQYKIPFRPSYWNSTTPNSSGASTTYLSMCEERETPPRNEDATVQKVLHKKRGIAAL